VGRQTSQEKDFAILKRTWRHTLQEKDVAILDAGKLPQETFCLRCVMLPREKAREAGKEHRRLFYSLSENGGREAVARRLKPHFP
jgi:hypothetical protein